MRILPVMDLLDGIVVRGVAGRREEYRPVTGQLADQADPHTVARAFRERLGLEELYVADLDAILDDRPNRSVYRRLAREGFRLIVDAGLRDIERAVAILEDGATAVIAALETSPGAAHLGELCSEVGSKRVIFSLDLQHGRPMGQLSSSATSEPVEVARQAIDAGVTRMIVLDLSGVGLGEGVPTLPLCRRLREAFPTLRLITGGGVRSLDDLRELRAIGLESALVGSALHDGRIGRGELTQFLAEVSS